MGRISPHPYLRDHLQDLNLKFSLSEHMDDIVLNKIRDDMENDTTPLIHIENQEPEQQLRQRRRSSAEVQTETEQKALQKASQTVAVSTGLTPFVKRGLQGIFYVGVGLAILALIGKIIHPTWQPLAGDNGSPSAAELEQKVNDMELQNNLMRAEIDLLNKQVKYLSSLNEQHQQKPGKYKEFKEPKTFKVWSGNGDTLKPVDITKQDLRKPYKCPDGSFVEIANMCVEQKGRQDPSIVEQFGQVVEDFKQQSEAFKTFEKVAEELQGFQDNPFEQLQEVFAEQVNKPSKNKPIYQTPEDFEQQNLPYKENYPTKPLAKGEESYKPHEHHSQRKEEYDSRNFKESKKYFGREDNKQSKEFKKYGKSETYPDNSKEWKSDRYNNNSKEKKYHKQKDFKDSPENSKENQSREKFNKQKRKHDKNHHHDDDDESGEWQEKYMKHREQQRKQNEQKYQQDNKNWYIKRGDSRENKRSGEKLYR